MTPAMSDLLAAKATPTAKLVALHMAMVVTSTTEPETIRPRDVAAALQIPMYEVERGWREAAKLGWFSSRRPDEVLMGPDALPRQALGRGTNQPPTTSKKGRKQQTTETEETIQ